MFRVLCETWEQATFGCPILFAFFAKGCDPEAWERTTFCRCGDGIRSKQSLTVRGGATAPVKTGLLVVVQTPGTDVPPAKKE